MPSPPKYPDAQTMVWPGLDAGKTNIEEQFELASTEVSEGLLGNQVAGLERGDRPVWR